MKLKKLLLFVTYVLCVQTGYAQNEAENLRIKEESKIVYSPHWFVQFQAGVSHVIGEIAFGDLMSPAMGVYAGYHFSPLWSVRAGLTGWEAKGGWVNPKYIYKYNYLQGNIDAVLDLSNLIGGFKPKRSINAYTFLGLGLNGAFNNDDAIAWNSQGHKLQHLWDGSKINPVGRGGLGANIRLSDRISLNAEINANILTDKYNSKKAGNVDWQFNALAGVTFRFGKNYKKTEPIYFDPEPVQPVTEPVVEVHEEPLVVIKEEPTPLPAIVEKESVKENIFFLINSSEIRESELPKISSLIEFLKNNPTAKVEICGYADKKTGNVQINKRLSERRASVVAEMLKNKGITPERITTDSKGDSVQPFNENSKNRVAICVTK